MEEVRVRIREKVGADWSDWFDGLTISHTANGETVLLGKVVDQSALYGLLNKLSGLGLQLTSLSSRKLK